MNKYSLYIDSYSLDPSIRTGGILINSSDHLDFISTLKEARIKYSEWTTTSKDNNVTDLSKEMIYSNKAQSYFKYGSKWCFDFSVNLSYSFRVSGDKILLLVKTKEVVSSSNQYMKADGFVLVFQSVEEIEKFIETLSIGGISDFMNSPKEEDLFK